MVERDEASSKLGIPNPSRSGNRFLEAEPATGNNRNQGKCLGTKLGALQLGWISGVHQMGVRSIITREDGTLGATL